jgi:membrane protease YdiL (CAAX protease family)
METKTITYLALAQCGLITFGFLLVSFLYRYYPDSYHWFSAIYIKHYGGVLLLVPPMWAGLALYLQSLDHGRFVTEILPYGMGIIVFVLLLYFFGINIGYAFTPDGLSYWNKVS